MAATRHESVVERLVAPPPPRERADRLATTLARAVRQRAETSVTGPLLQRYTVDHLPYMDLQLFHGSIIPPFFVDLNCGWYAQISAIRQRAAALHLDLPPLHEVLPKTTLLAFSPGAAGRDLSTDVEMPTTVAEWKSALRAKGPIIVSGKLGAADWGPIFRGVGHYILIVGAHGKDDKSAKLSYLDPLQGNKLKRARLEHMRKRMDPDAFAIDDDELRKHDRRRAAREQEPREHDEQPA